MEGSIEYRRLEETAKLDYFYTELANHKELNNPVSTITSILSFVPVKSLDLCHDAPDSDEWMVIDPEGLESTLNGMAQESFDDEEDDAPLTAEEQGELEYLKTIVSGVDGFMMNQSSVDGALNPG